MNNQYVSQIKDYVAKHMGLRVINITDRGQWIRHHYEVELSNSKTVFFKLITHQEPTGGLRHEHNVVNILKNNQLPAPEVLMIDESCQYIEKPFLVQTRVGGKRLGDILMTVSIEEKIEIYREIGKFYRKLHSIKGKKSGVCSDKDLFEVKYPISPNEYMYKAEILNGSGKLAYEKGLISKELYNGIISLWEDNMEYLKDHQPSLIHMSAFFWNIYLEKSETWKVTKILSLGDVMWWDEAYDIATLKYPPFGELDKEVYKGFLSEYKKEPEEKRILLYSIIHRLCEKMGVYLEPDKYKNKCKIDLESELTKIINRLNGL
ncbi:aminoglycoside phosphotransferase family protein [Clostridiaceae bacterium M8S5]|nr:aminoglycoside phosphotransferase family protein [Clostridiaceae bacterium M8S5]